MNLLIYNEKHSDQTARFTPEQGGGFSVRFPDLENCYTCGGDMVDSLVMAEDVLALTLYRYEKDSLEIPSPSKKTDLPLAEGEFVNFVACDTLEYRKMYQ